MHVDLIAHDLSRHLSPPLPDCLRALASRRLFLVVPDDGTLSYLATEDSLCEGTDPGPHKATPVTALSASLFGGQASLEVRRSMSTPTVHCPSQEQLTVALTLPRTPGITDISDQIPFQTSRSGWAGYKEEEIDWVVAIRLGTDCTHIALDEGETDAHDGRMTWTGTLRTW